MIFHHFLGEEFFDNDDSIQFIGIGSILGLKKKPGKKIVFSSGFASGNSNAYGTVPVIDDTYDIICVRGPKTARLLNLPLEKAIADGAILLPRFYSPPIRPMKFKCSLILHHKSLDFYTGWEKVCSDAGIHLIDVRKNIEEILSEIVSSEKILCEAMHGAIVADAYRIPWISVNFYPHINTFKWEDWCESLKMKHEPVSCENYLHDVDFLSEVIKKRTFLPMFLSKQIARIVLKMRIKKVIDFLIMAKDRNGKLSEENILKSRQDQLIEKLNLIRSK
jgi:succinoglycan biosynthesis protein ExoV